MVPNECSEASSVFFSFFIYEREIPRQLLFLLGKYTASFTKCLYQILFGHTVSYFGELYIPGEALEQTNHNSASCRTTTAIGSPMEGHNREKACCKISSIKLMEKQDHGQKLLGFFERCICH